jgi:hypothetical protein
MVVSEVLIICGHCGNKANCKVRTEYTQDLSNEYDEHFITTWRILECPSCSRLILQQGYIDSTGPFIEEEKRILYPIAKARLTNLPVEIAKEYEATLKVRNISSNACAVLARRTLEAVFTHEGATGNSLIQKVDSLIKSASIPHLLADVAHLGRRIGNLGAHFDKGDATEEDVAIMLDFLETILQYLYVVPAKVAAVKARLNKTPEERW